MSKVKNNTPIYVDQLREEVDSSFANPMLNINMMVSQAPTFTVLIVESSKSKKKKKAKFATKARIDKSVEK